MKYAITTNDNENDKKLQKTIRVQGEKAKRITFGLLGRCVVIRSSQKTVNNYSYLVVSISISF